MYFCWHEKTICHTGIISILLVHVQVSAAFTAVMLMLENDTLRVGNTLIERQWLWNNGALVPVSIINKTVLPYRITEMPVMDMPAVSPSSSDFAVEEAGETAISHAMLSAVIISDYSDYRQKTVISVYPESPAVRIQYAFKSAPGDQGPADLEEFILDRITLPSLHYTIKTVEFFDRTDVNNNLVE